jgi:hypothetical protein
MSLRALLKMWKKLGDAMNVLMSMAESQEHKEGGRFLH